MSDAISRYSTIGDWVFETKFIRALKVPQFGQPYQSMASMTINGDHLYIDSQMTVSGEDFSRRDFMTFYQFCQQMQVKQVHYDKMRNGVREPRIIDIAENMVTRANIRLVK